MSSTVGKLTNIDDSATDYQASKTWRTTALGRLLARPVAVLASGGLLIMVIVAVFAPYLAPYDPAQQFRREGLSEVGAPLPPNQRFWLGTDALGRDVLSRTIWASRVSLTIGVVAALLTNLVALVVGGVAGFVGGTTDGLIMRFVDMVMSAPTFFITLLIIVLTGPSVWILITVIVLFGWTYGARLYRAEIRALRERSYVEAAYALGGSSAHIFFRHMLPHLVPLVLTYVTLGVPGAIFAEAGLSFIGLGIQPPNPSWGAMIFGGMRFFRFAPWIVMVPIAALMFTVLSLTLLGSSLRDILDPVRQGR